LGGDRLYSYRAGAGVAPGTLVPSAGTPGGVHGVRCVSLALPPGPLPLHQDTAEDLAGG